MTKEHHIERVDTSTPRGKCFRVFLEKIDADERCDKCGGLPYDIVFSHKGVLYKFCLYKIEKDGEILAETDYDMLYEYTRKGGVMMSIRIGKPRLRAHVT
jgi:hypothetical protein